MNSDLDSPLDKLPRHLQERIPSDVREKVSANADLQRSIFNLAELFAMLKSDVTRLENRISNSESESQWERRSAYRTTYAWIEGAVYLMKHVACKTQNGFYQADFERGEIAFLLEESYHLRNNGDVEVRLDRFVPIDKNLRLAFALFARGLGINTNLEVGTSGWEKFKEGIKVRNRLTHPKVADELRVTDNEMEALSTVIAWFDDQVSKVVTDAMALVRPMRDRIKDDGRMEQKQILDKAFFALNMGSEVEAVQSLINKVIVSGEALSQSSEERLKEADSLLNDLKNTIVKMMSD